MGASGPVAVRLRYIEEAGVNRRVLIRFCRTCGFGVLAEQIADALRQEFGLVVECQPSYWGCFRVDFDKIEVFNRWKTRRWIGRLGFGRTPSSDEIVGLIRHRLNPSPAGTLELN